MRITNIVERPVPLRGSIRNSLVNFSGHTVSLLAVHTDVVGAGKPVVGVAFNSIGRFAQSGILRDRLIPRVLSTDPETLLGEDGLLDPAKVLAACMRDEKPGGHGDRAAAASVLELACWDAVAKAMGEPAARTIARRVRGCEPQSDVAVYAAGGYYYGCGDDVARLRAELRAYQDLGYREFKIKIGGADLAADLRRIEAAIEVAGDAGAVAVDANGRFDRAAAVQVAEELRPYGLRWFEEPGDPLDFGLNAEVVEAFQGPVATGENLFSVQDVRNLLAYGGLRPRCDVLQMDAGLSYGLTEYLGMIAAVEEAGFDRRWLHPHGGHLINLHIVAGLGLGGCEAYPGVFQPFGGYPDDVLRTVGRIAPSQAPGFGLEEKLDLDIEIRTLIDLGGAR
ncbi:L-alanine-DL-glutamate epimerase [Pseudonocardia thermophila]|jgi:L-alanine-DL-glutamate epimerase and related enzymes of enolase superfamily|uniref:L-alanine-DL-glutamate epimerase n=1 Tax=Pseudonocardia thermophila TaxID=1848 RepID=A0A1M6XIP4_PSETH|nr:enolase C-terminal domain-like protein [Pseudonocardia thermophila]SHL05811.1 L-alanine-DL-glutamate epimerase [Pseudonocardia thermophila]